MRPAHLVPLLCLVACAPAPPRASIVGGHVIAQSAFRSPLLVLEAGTGKVLATLPADGYADAPPTAKGLFFVHGDGGLVARSAATGAARWRVFSKASYYTTPVATDSAVFVFDPKPDAHVWRGYATESGAKVFDVPCDDYAPLAAGGGLLFTIEDGALVARNLEDGKTKYRVVKDVEAPIVAGDERFFARVDDGLGVFRSENGRLERTLDVGTDALGTVGGVAPGLVATTDVVIAAGDGGVRALDASTGKKRWEITLEDAESLALADEVLVVAAGETVVGLDPASGKKRWSTPVEPSVDGVSAGGGLVAARAGAHVVVLEAATGKRRFAQEL